MERLYYNRWKVKLTEDYDFSQLELDNPNWQQHYGDHIEVEALEDIQGYGALNSNQTSVNPESASYWSYKRGERFRPLARLLSPIMEEHV